MVLGRISPPPGLTEIKNDIRTKAQMLIGHCEWGVDHNSR